MSQKLKSKNVAVPQEQSKVGMQDNLDFTTVGFLLIQIIIGYEWFISGLTKVIRADFISGLAQELSDKSAGVHNWYADFLNRWIIPNAVVFGYLIEATEVLIGLAFIGAALLWLFAWGRVPKRVRSFSFLLVSLAALGGVFMAINFHLANGYSHPWLFPEDSFEEGVDFDSLLAVVNAVIAIVYVFLFRSLWLGAKRQG